jgi:hypothetical protein
MTVIVMGCLLISRCILKLDNEFCNSNAPDAHANLASLEVFCLIEEQVTLSENSLAFFLATIHF